MPQRHILYLDNSHLFAYALGGGTVSPEGAFTHDEAGLQACNDYLKAHSRSIFMLLVDVAEEGFQFEDIPYSSGKDRVAIVKRKLGQHFYGTPFTLAISQGRQKSGRRDERLMMMALTRPQTLDPWLALLRENHARLTGIYSLPQVIAQLLPKDAAQQQLLLIQTHGGLRQAFFADQQLRFSRLTTLATGSKDESAIATAIEAGKIHQYLSSQRLIDRTRPLATRVLVHPAEAAAMRERCRDTTELNFEFADILVESKRVGFRATLADSRSDALFCHLLGRRTPTEQFATAAECQYFRLWQTRFALKGVSAVILLAGVTFAAKQGLDLMSTQEATAQIQQQTRADQQRYDAVLQALPKISISTDNLRALVDRFDQITLRARGPAPTFVQLSQSLDVFPGISIEKLDWKITDVAVPPPPPGTAAPPPPPPIPPNMMNGPYAQVVVVAQLPLGMAGNQRGQLNMVAEFTKHLAATPDTLVTILQPPVDTQSGKTLKSGEENRAAEAPKFTFRLTRKL